MPIFQLNDEFVFPAPDLADDTGVLAVGGDLRPERLILAYSNGIFPWPHQGMPMLWFSPDPRMVLPSAELRVSRRLERTIRQKKFDVRFDTSFDQVIDGCASIKRKHEKGTWISEEMIRAYTRLFELGFVHCAGSWLDGELVGGLYGVSIGGVFIGESMFARVSNASKVAFVTFVRHIENWGIDLIDAQVYTEHMAQFGAREWPREKYLDILAQKVNKPTLRGPWKIPETQQK